LKRPVGDTEFVCFYMSINQCRKVISSHSTITLPNNLAARARESGFRYLVTCNTSMEMCEPEAPGNDGGRACNWPSSYPAAGHRQGISRFVRCSQNRQKNVQRRP
jgi:hypothetical protein